LNQEQEKSLIIGHLNVIFTTSSHRFGKIISKFVAFWNKKYKGHLKAKSQPIPLTDTEFAESVQDIKNFVAGTYDQLEKYYVGLSTSSPNACRYCESTIYQLLFNQPQFYENVFKLFKKKYEGEDQIHEKKITRNVNNLTCSSWN